MRDAVIGGGFFGCLLAKRLAELGREVTIYERDLTIMSRASKNNVARVHRGYHYVNGMETAARTRANYEKFEREFGECLHSCDMYYAIARDSAMSASTFESRCKSLDLSLAAATDCPDGLVNPSHVEAIYKVDEKLYNYVRLSYRLMRDLRKLGVEILIGARVDRVYDGPSVRICGQSSWSPQYDNVYLCGYAGINSVLRESSLPLIPVRLQSVEVCHVLAPSSVSNAGLTVMCGPFFSLIPWPASPAGLAHTLYHVKCAREYSWDDVGDPLPQLPLNTNVDEMVELARHICPVLGECRLFRSVWETRALAGETYQGDERPMVVRRDHGIRGLHVVLGGKIDVAYDMFDLLKLGDT